MGRLSVSHNDDDGRRMCRRCAIDPAQVCAECVESLAAGHLGEVPRSGIEPKSCGLCEDGPAEWCGTCAVTHVGESRSDLRELGRPVRTWRDQSTVTYYGTAP